MPKWIATGQGSYRKLGDGKIEMTWRDRDGKKFRRIVHMETDEVLKFLAENARAISRKKAGVPGGTWPDAWRLYEERGTRKGFSLKQMVSAKQVYESFAAFANCPLDKVTGPCVQDWLDQEADRLQADDRPGWARTTNKKRAILMSFFHVARKFTEFNPVYPTDKYDEAKRTPRTVTPEEYMAVWSQSEPMFRDLLDFLLLTGCRFGEAASMRLSDLDKKTGIWKLRKRKHNVPLSIPLNANLLEIVLRQKGGQGGYVWGKWVRPSQAEHFKGGSFVNDWGKKMDSWWALRCLHKRCDAAGVERFRIHDLRHACGSWMGQMGAKIEDIQKVLGHSQPSTSALYAHGDPTAIVLEWQNKVMAMRDGAKQA